MKFYARRCVTCGRVNAGSVVGRSTPPEPLYGCVVVTVTEAPVLLECSCNADATTVGELLARQDARIEGLREALQAVVGNHEAGMKNLGPTLASAKVALDTWGYE